jgi:hypothetical protein
LMFVYCFINVYVQCSLVLRSVNRVSVNNRVDADYLVSQLSAAMRGSGGV